MAKIVKSKKKKASKFNIFCVVFFTFALAARLFTSIMLGSMNNEINTNIQKAQNEAETLRIENQKLSIEILQNKERIYTIAQDAGLEQQSNIVSIAGGASETE